MNKIKASLADFVAAPTGRVWLHPQHDQFAYSDGREVEERILQLLQQTGDLSVGSPELLSHVEDWPTEYHFSDVRANLLRHLPLGPQVRVLELGAGCGALTRYLGEMGSSVAAVEGSLQRALCAAERVRDLEHVSVYCSDFQDIAFRSEFDVVTLIGVLEYAPRFFVGPDPLGQCLAVARSALAPGGTLVVAIENQLGLKYFAGATEDHLGTHFSGIEDRYGPAGVRTLGRRQLEQALRAAGFADLSFQYPFPDYKLPQAIVFEAAVQEPQFRAAEIVRHLYARDYAGKDLRAFDTSQVWPVLEANGLLGELANSFLVLARETRPQLAGGAAAGAEPLAIAYSVGRARRFQTQTEFRALLGGAIVCEKTLVHPGAVASGEPVPGMTHRMLRDPYVPGPTLHSAITAALRAQDPQRVMELLRRWMEFLDGHSGAGAARSWSDRLPGEYWDCTPDNLIDGDGQLHYFDAEWVSDPGPTKGLLLLRYIFSLGFREASAPQFRACFRAANSGPAVRAVLSAFGLELTDQVLADFAAEVNRTNEIIFPAKPPIVLDINHFKEPPAAAASGWRRGGLRSLIGRLVRALSGLSTR